MNPLDNTLINNAGVYTITCKNNSKFYIGSTVKQRTASGMSIYEAITKELRITKNKEIT